jgi:hypothetical protein
MRKIGSALALLIVGLFLVSFIAVPANAVTTPTTSWEVGDKWAMGKEIDLGANFSGPWCKTLTTRTPSSEPAE